MWICSQCWGWKRTFSRGLQTFRGVRELYTEGARDGTRRGGDGKVREGRREEAVPPKWVLRPRSSPPGMVTDVLSCPRETKSTQSPCSCLHVTFFNHPNIVILGRLCGSVS